MLMTIKIYGSTPQELIQALQAIQDNIQNNTLNGTDQCLRGNAGYFAMFKTKLMNKARKALPIKV